MKFIASFLASLLLFAYSLCFGQVVPDSNKTVIIFNSAPKDKTRKTGEDNIIKLSPLGVISGCIPVSYEKKFTDFLSVQASAGLTSRNYIRIGTEDTEFSKVKTSYSPLPSGTSDIADPLYNYDNRKSKIGYMFGLQPRIYFQNEALEGSFIGISYDYLRYNYQIARKAQSGTGYTHSGHTINEFEIYNEFMVNYGFQKIYDNLTLEYGAAIGIRNLNGEKYVAAEVNNQLVDGLAKYDKSAINFNVFFRVGYHF